MKKETTTWLRNFLSSFLAAVCGIAITFGINNCVGATKKAETARLLAEQTVKKMGRTHQQLHEYQALYDTIDSTSMILHLAILADTLDRVDESVANTFINTAISEYVQADVDNAMLNLSAILTISMDMPASTGLFHRKLSIRSALLPTWFIGTSTAT